MQEEPSNTIWDSYKDINTIDAKSKFLGFIILVHSFEDIKIIKDLMSTHSDDEDKKRINNEFNKNHNKIYFLFIFLYLNLIGRMSFDSVKSETFDYFLSTLFNCIKDRIAKNHFFFSKKNFDKNFREFQIEYFQYVLEDNNGFISPNTIMGEFIDKLGKVLNLENRKSCLIGLPGIILGTLKDLSVKEIFHNS